LEREQAAATGCAQVGAKALPHQQPHRGRGSVRRATFNILTNDSSVGPASGNFGKLKTQVLRHTLGQG